MGRLRKWLILFSGLFVTVLSSSLAQTFLPKGVRFTTGPVSSTRTFPSANGKFRVLIEGSGITTTTLSVDTRATVTMMRLDGGNQTVLWRANTRIGHVPYLQDHEVFVSDDGSFVIFAASPGKWTLLKNGREARPLSLRVNKSPGAIVTEDRIFVVDEIKGDRLVAFWTSYLNEWIVFSVVQEKEIAITPELEKRFNAQMREKILGVLSRARASMLKARVNALSPKISKIASAAIPTVQMGELRQIHYEFLATLQNPADRIWFERLIEPKNPIPPPGWPAGVRWRGYRYSRFAFPAAMDPFALMSWEDDRLIGDWLLEIFDGKRPKDEIDRDPEKDRKLRYLGKVNGAILLPTSLPRKAGVMRVYLAPEELAGKVWDDARVESIEETFPQPRAENDTTDELTFLFATVTPGSYKLKAIWDKRPTFEDKTAPGPGDYESPWIGPIKVIPGENKMIFLACTNRTSGAESYYAADDLARRHWTPEDAPWFTTMDPEFRDKKEISSLPFSSCLIATNSQAPNRRDALERIHVVSVPSLTNPNVIPRPSELWIAWNKSYFLHGEPAPPLESIRILDEHGCAYVPQIRHVNRRLAVARFESFPRTAATFRLVGFAPGNKGEPVFDYSLTNLARGPMATNAPPLELPVDLTVGDVTMRVSRVWGFGSKPWMGATFTERGEPSTNWWASEINFADTEGNFIDPAEMCREQKTVRVIGRISRAGSYPEETRRFEFAIHRTAKDP